MNLILWPAIISIVITVLRLVGELQGWSRALFNPVAGGGGALVGISWLPFLFGPYFAWNLARSGKGTSAPWKAVGLSVLGIAIAVGSFATVQGLKLGLGAVMAAFHLTPVSIADGTVGTGVDARRPRPTTWRRTSQSPA